MRTAIYAIVLLLDFARIPPASAQPALKFDRIDLADGLSTMPAASAMQDDLGFLWIGTWYGLYRYDGYRFEGFWHDENNPHSISHDWALSPFIDDAGVYWVATNGGGLNRFNPASGAFTSFRHDPADPRSLSHDEVSQVYQDRAGTLWVGTGGGLNRYDPETGQFTRYLDDSEAPGSLRGNQVRVIHEDAAGALWVGTGNPFVPGQPGALNRYDRSSDTFTSFQPVPEDPINVRNHVQTIYTDETGIFWVTTWDGGFYTFNQEAGAFTPLDILSKTPSDPNRGANFGVTSILVQRDADVVWVGTFGGGLYRHDLSNGATSQYVFDPADPFSLSDDRVWGLYLDREGLLWVGTHSGLHRTDPSGNFPGFALEPENPSIAEWVTDLYEDLEGRVWIGTSTGRIVAWDQGSDSWTFYTPPAQPCRQWRFPGVAISPGRQGMLWIATVCGFYEFEPASGRFARYDTTNPLPDDLASDQPLRIIEDEEGYLWFGTQPVLRLNPEDGTYVRYPHDPGNPSSLSADDVDAIYRDRSGTIWVGTTDGLNRFEPATDSFTRLLHDQPGQPIAVTGILESEGHPYTLWLTTDVAGLIHIDPVSGDYTSYTVRDGLPTNTWFDLTQDQEGYFWLFSPRGVSTFEPETRSVQNYDYGADGLVEMQFGRRAIQSGRDGTLLLGGQGGMNRFSSAGFHPEPRPPPVVLSGLEIRGTAIVPGVDSPMKSPLHMAPHLTLSHTQNDLTISYVGLSMRNASLIRYRHRLDKYDDEWVYARNQRTARYTNLSPGTYSFSVAAANGTGPWQTEPSTFSFTITPPWWRTGPAYVLFVVLVGGLLFGLRHYEVSRQRLKHSLELEQVEVDKLRELDQTRSRFFANISHEFRTPLTLILGPVVEAIEKKQDLQVEQLPLVQRNARRLLRLVNQLLDTAKFEAGSMRLRAARADLVSFLKSITYSFSTLAEQQEIDLRFETESTAIEAFYEQEKLEQVFYNILSNAFKFTPQGGAVTVTCRTTEDGFVEVAVRDTGIGISADRLPYVFDRFYQVPDATPSTNEGTGIGLSLTRALVELHHGTISVTSEPSAGAEFVVSLPLGDAHLKEEERTAASATEKSALLEKDEPDSGAVLMPSPTSDEIMGQLRVLIVEDNADVATYVQSHLDGDYEVHIAGDGRQGLHMARDLIPDLIITDVMMPHMDGYAFSQQIRSDERTSHVPIVMLTAKAEEADKLAGLEIGVDDYLLKPFSPRELQVRVRNLIALRQRLRKKFATATVIRPSDIEATSLDRSFLERVVKHIEGHLSDSEFTTERLAEEVGMSISQLNRKLNALIDQPAGQLLRLMRLQRGADLLAQRAGSIAEIAYLVGFSSQAHFSTSFKKQFGVTPSVYQKKHLS